MNRREWLNLVAVTVPLLCLPAPVVGAVAPPPTKHPHDVLLRRLKQLLIRFVSVQHGKLVDADFTQPAPFYDRVLTFWEHVDGDVCVIMDYVGKDPKLAAMFDVCFGSNQFVFALIERGQGFDLEPPPPHPRISYPGYASTPEHPHAAWMQQHLGVDSAVLVSFEEHPCRLADQTIKAVTTVWHDSSSDKDHLIVQVGNQFNAGYFEGVAAWNAKWCGG